jgi:hypothetical protein
MRYLLLILLGASLVGCVPYSDNPITEPNQQTMDSSIYGSWFWKEDNESGFIHIGLDPKTKLLRVAMVEFDKDGGVKLSEFAGHTSSLADNKYLNLKWVIPVDEEPGYLFVKYEVSDGRFGISLMNNDAVEKAIIDGSLKGEVKGDNWFTPVHIAEESKKLQEFVVKNDKELFREKTYLRRLDLPKHTPQADAPAEVPR